MKHLVIDTRDGQRLFGEVQSLSSEEESTLGSGHTDIIRVGAGPLAVIIPSSAARIYLNVNTLPVDAINCD